MHLQDFVKKYDPQNQFEVLVNSFEQIDFAWNNKIDLSSIKKSEIKNILISGLGGSAISADLIKNYLYKDLQLPMIVNRNYNLPTFADEKTLFIASSYSGNTEETISSLNEAISKKCKIICISTGGKVGAIAEHNNLPFVKIKSGFQPRYALGLSFFSLLKIFQELELIPDQNENVNRIRSIWENEGEKFSVEENYAYKIAESLIGFIPVIYSVSDFTNAVGYRLKSQINENSKLHAFHNELPEMNHNEIIGWESYQEKHFKTKIIEIEDENYHPQVKKRFKVLNGLLSNSGLEVITLKSNEKEFKVRLLELVYICDWISYYLGILRGFDPSEINYINTLKENL
jgi:glucose/mannose-6-phosphate isomerase